MRLEHCANARNAINTIGIGTVMKSLRAEALDGRHTLTKITNEQAADQLHQLDETPSSSQD